MIIRSHEDGFVHPLASEITNQQAYLSRRSIIRGLALHAAAAGLSSWSAREAMAQTLRPGVLPALNAVPSTIAGALVMDKTTPYKDATTYNNFYEFGTDKSDPARRAHTLKTDPWRVEIEGLVKKPGRYHLEDLMKWGAMEERIYRLRCVEGLSLIHISEPTRRS